METLGCFNGDLFRPPSATCGLEKKVPGGGGDHFVMEDLLDFLNEDEEDASGGFSAGDEAAFDAATGHSTDSSTVTVIDSCSNSFSGGEAHFPCEAYGRTLQDVRLSGDLLEPYDELAELEWLSNFVDESSFSGEDFNNLPLISGTHSAAGAGVVTIVSSASSSPSAIAPQPAIFLPEVPVPGKVRSKRSRVAPGSWSSRLLVLSPSMTPRAPSTEPELVTPPPPESPPKKVAKLAKKKADPSAVGGPALAPAADGRKCLHCQTDKTPQWRTGPMGPKTLYNACGVRYKSGRLVPEYRPAASPTFVLSKHSNSHRKVLELRRQKDILQQQQHVFYDGQPTMSVAIDDFLVHHQMGPDFRQLI